MKDLVFIHTYQTVDHNMNYELTMVEGYHFDASISADEYHKYYFHNKDVHFISTRPHSVRVWSYNWLTCWDILYAIHRVVTQFSTCMNRDVRLFRKYRNHPDFCIIATDKNLGLAVIATEDYKNMVLQHLRDPHIYELQRDITQEMIIEPTPCRIYEPWSTQVRWYSVRLK